MHSMAALARLSEVRAIFTTDEFERGGARVVPGLWLEHMAQSVAAAMGRIRAGEAALRLHYVPLSMRPPRTMAPVAKRSGGRRMLVKLLSCSTAAAQPACRKASCCRMARC